MSAGRLSVIGLLLGTLAASPRAAGGMEPELAAPRWEFAPEVSYFRYVEPGIMKDSGVLYGVAGSHTRYRQDKLLRVEAGLAFGYVDYEGALIDGTPYTMKGCRDFLLNLRALCGRLGQTGGWDRQLYAGLGYRALIDDSTQDPAGYVRMSNYFYAPLGLKVYHNLAGGWQVALGGELDLLLLGVQISDVSEDGTVTNVQWPGFGVRASVEVRRRTLATDLALAPFVQYWWVEESSTSSDGWYEPRNNTLQYGVSLIWRF